MQKIIIRKDEKLMGKIIEIVTFQVKSNISEEKLMEVSSAFEKLLENKIEGYLNRTLAKSPEENNWVEIIRWQSMELAKAALDSVVQYEAFHDYCAVLEENSTICHLEEKS